MYGMCLAIDKQIGKRNDKDESTFIFFRVWGSGGVGLCMHVCVELLFPPLTLRCCLLFLCSRMAVVQNRKPHSPSEPKLN